MDGYGAPQPPRHDYGDMHQHRGGEYDDRMDAAKRMKPTDDDRYRGGDVKSRDDGYGGAAGGGGEQPGKGGSVAAVLKGLSQVLT